MSTDTEVRIGPFQVQGRLGAGGMAEVWRARHVELDQTVAIKVMTGPRAVHPRFRASFRFEVQAAARLNHPSIVRVFDYGVIGKSAGDYFLDGSPYLVMEVADRGSLDRTRVSSWGAVRRIVLQVLDALAYAHARGLVHRDVKPANLLLASTAAGQVRVKLADFGIAYLDTTVPESEGKAVGTFAYTPPEQLHGEWRRFGPPTDLYALGCLVWQLVTGEPPFGTVGVAQLAVRHLVGEVPPLEPILPVPDELEGWLRRLLEKQPGDRFQRAADAALAFERFANRYSDATDVLDSDMLLADAETGPLCVVQTMTYPDTIVMPTSLPELSQVSSGVMASAEALVLGDAGASVAAHGMATDAVPALPSTWRRASVEYEPGIAGLGLGLFGLREIPFVGRESERDDIWNALRMVTWDGAARGVVLRGSSGAGKSRMAQWLCRRASELGSVTVVRAVHAAGRRQGLRDLLERYFVTFGLEDRDEVAEQVRSHLGGLWPKESPEFLAGEVAAVTATLLPDEHGRASSRERIATVTRVLARAAMRRPLLLWLDDVQWDLESIALAAHLLEQDDLPVLVLMTVQDEATSLLADVEHELATLVRHHTLQQLDVPPLDEVQQTELVRRLIGLDEAVCRAVSVSTRGNPLFAIQLVGDWVSRGSLVPTRTGFVLRDGATTPGDLHTLWTRRLEHICARHGGLSQQVALELAATFGGAVRDAEWQAACEVARLSVDEQLLPTLVNQGMVIVEGDGWRFVHRLLTASLERLAREAKRWKKHHGSCADGLRALEIDTPDLVERLATHYLEAERYRDALRPLAEAIWERLAARDYHQAGALIAEHRRAIEGADVGDEVPRVEQMLMEGILQGRVGAASLPGHFDEVIAIAGPRGWDREVGIALSEKAYVAGQEARLDEALELYASAWASLERTDARTEQAMMLEGRAWVHKSKGDTDSAQRDLEAALDIHRAAEDKTRELNAINSLAFTFLAEGDYESSREIAHIGVELGRDLGHRGAEAGCWTTLGEIERFEGAYDTARAHYRRAEQLDLLCGNKHVQLVRANAAMVEVGARNWDEALRLFDIIEPIMVAGGTGWMSPFFMLARACCFLAKRELAHAETLWDGAVRQIDDAHIIERDVAWLAEIAADVASENDDAAWGRRALSYAAEQWEGLGDETKLRRARARLVKL